MELLYGVAQGSVLGPILFKIYIRSFYQHVEATKFNVEGFADDHQLIKEFLVAFQKKALGINIQACLQHIGKWMNEFFLKLNESKTKILIMAPPSVQSEIFVRGIFIGNDCIRFVDSAKNLGVILDNVLSFENQINKVVKSSFNTLRQLHQVKGYFSTDDLKQLVSSSILCNIDYCNALYFGISSCLVKKLQHVQNCAVKLVMKKKNFLGKLDSAITDLHWLKVPFRSVFKQLLIVHNCIRGNAPNEIQALLFSTDSERTNRLKQATYSNKYGCRAFSYTGPKLWNMLPGYVRDVDETENFKKILKTFLMKNGNKYLRSLQYV